MSKFAVVVVTYFPNNASIQSLNRISRLCHKLIIIDNTPADTITDFPKLQNITVYKFRENVGLATALNKGTQLAGQQGYKNIFLLDQDSRLPHHFFKNMLIFKSKIDSLVCNCKLYAPNFYDRNSKTFAKFPIITRFTVKHTTCGKIQSGPCNYATIAITSGTLITYSGYKEIGPFRDDYFIDFIDNEYCLRAKKFGFSVAVNCDVVLNHSIGKRSVHHFLGMTIKPNHHPPVRRYYISRNGIRTAIDYIFSYPSYIPLITARMIHELISILLYEDSKYKKIKALIYGIYHGLIGKMGKCKIGSLISYQKQT